MSFCLQLHNYHKKIVTLRCSLFQVTDKGERQPHAHRLIKRVGNEEVDDPHSLTVTADDNFTAVYVFINVFNILFLVLH